jgi:flagellar motor switch protein FliN/FliY
MLETANQVSETSMPTMPKEENSLNNIKRLLDIELDIVVRFGTTTMSLSEIIKIGNGSVIELDRTIDEPVELMVNGYTLARGQVVVINGYYGVKVTEIVSTIDKATSIF